MEIANNECVVCGTMVDFNGRFRCCYACVKFYKRYKSTVAPKCRNFNNCLVKRTTEQGQKITEDGRVWRGICAGCRWLRVKTAFENGEYWKSSKIGHTTLPEIEVMPQVDDQMEQNLLEIVTATVSFKSNMQSVSCSSTFQL